MSKVKHETSVNECILYLESNSFYRNTTDIVKKKVTAFCLYFQYATFLNKWIPQVENDALHVPKGEKRKYIHYLLLFRQEWSSLPCNCASNIGL